MNRRNLVIAIVLLLVLMGAIYCVSIYFVYPYMLSKMSSVEKMEPYLKVRSQADSDVFAATMEEIQNRWKQGDGCRIKSTRMRSNPFLWSEEIATLIADKQIVREDKLPEYRYKPEPQHRSLKNIQQKLMPKLHLSMVLIRMFVAT